MCDRAAIREAFVQIVREEYPNAGDGIVAVFDAALAATPTPRTHERNEHDDLTTATTPTPTTPRWWGVEHWCDGVDRVYPTLHWADEPQEGVGPRRAFECDACGDRYNFHEASATPAEALDVERLRHAVEKVQNMNPLDYLDNGDAVDAYAAEYARLSQPEEARP